MTPDQQQLHDQVLYYLQQARQGMQILMSGTSDWTAKAQIQTQFRYLERDCVDFGLHQLGRLFPPALRP